jgi:hypothetical protein
MHLAGLSGLEFLALEDCRVSDAGLVHLKGLRQLKHLQLGGTEVTPAGVAVLQRDLPDCYINRERIRGLPGSTPPIE